MRKVLLLVSVVILTGAAHSKGPQTKAPQSGSAPTIAAKYGGRIIVSLEFTGSERFTSDFLRSAMLNKWIGQPFGYFALRGELSRLNAVVFEPRGYLRAELGELQIEEAPDGVKVNVPISEGRRYRVGDVTAEGSTLPNVSDLIQMPALKRGEILTRLALRKAVERLTRLYNREGYTHAGIDVEVHWTDPVETPEEGQADIVFNVSEGASYKGRTIASIEFDGNDQLSCDVLKGALKYAKVGERFEPERLQTDLDRLRVLVYADKGFLKAHFGEPGIVERNDGIGITITVNEGRQYSVGKITVEDCTLLRSDEVIRLLRLNEGDLVRGTLIHKGQQKLAELYHAQGFIQFNSDLDIKWTEPQETPLEGTADLVLKIEEGKRYHLRSITLQGSLPGDHKFLRALFLIHDGDIYNDRLMEAGFRGLNSLGRFEHIGPEDWKVQADEGAAQVDVVIALKSRAAQP